MAITLETLRELSRDAAIYRDQAMASVRRNAHMNNHTGIEIDQRDIDALLVDFINFVAMQRGGDYGMYTTDLR